MALPNLNDMNTVTFPKVFLRFVRSLAFIYLDAYVFKAFPQVWTWNSFAYEYERNALT